MNLTLTPKQQAIFNQIEAQLHTRKIRLTKGRKEVLRIILAADHPTFNDIVERLEQAIAEKPNIMSVYNTVNMLLANHIIYANTFDSKQICYEVAIPKAGHLKCDNCHRILHLNQLEPLNHQFAQLAQEHHWSYNHFKIEIHGLCQECQQEMDSSPALLA